MSDVDLVCALLRVLVSDHAYGKPRPRDVVVSKASHEKHEGGAAKEAYEAVRDLDLVVDRGRRGVMLDNDRFVVLVQFLYDECGWDRFELKLRIKHFEGWNEVDWRT